MIAGGYAFTVDELIVYSTYRPDFEGKKNRWFPEGFDCFLITLEWIFIDLDQG